MIVHCLSSSVRLVNLSGVYEQSPRPGVAPGPSDRSRTGTGGELTVDVDFGAPPTDGTHRLPLRLPGERTVRGDVVLCLQVPVYICR